MSSPTILFLLCSYSVGWAMVGREAKKTHIVDLCKFVRTFIFAPFVTFGLLIIGFVGILLIPAIVSAFIIHLFTIIKVMSIVLLIVSGFALTGYYVVTPVVKKSYGVVKPFSSKLCVVLYRKK